MSGWSIPAALPLERAVGPEVWVGNIPFKTSEEEIRALFSQVGPVVSFNMVFDPVTGKPSGYGFCRFKDSQTAAHAIKRFNDVELRGRLLKVGLPGGAPSKEARNARAASQRAEAILGPAGFTARRPPLEPAQGSTPEHRVLAALETMPPEQLLELVLAVRGRVLEAATAEEGARALAQNQALAYAALQAVVMLGLISVQEGEGMLGGVEPALPPGFGPGLDGSGHPGLPVPLPDPRLVETFQAVLRMTPEQLTQLRPDEKLKVESIRQAYFQMQQHRMG